MAQDISNEITTESGFQAKRLLRDDALLEIHLGARTRRGQVVSPALILTPGSDPAGRTLLQQLWNTGNRLRHPNILRMLDWIELEGRPFLLTEHAPGITLLRLMHSYRSRDEAMPAAIAMEIGRQICAGLSRAHGEGTPPPAPDPIIHGALHPGLVIITRGGVVKIAGFGAPPPRSGESISAGSDLQVVPLAYAAPEVARGDPPSPASDLFSLGVLLFEMLASTPLYPVGDTPLLTQVRRADIDDRLALLEHCPVDVVAVVAMLLTPTPAERCTSAREAGRAMGAAIPPGSSELGALKETVRATLEKSETEGEDQDTLSLPLYHHGGEERKPSEEAAPQVVPPSGPASPPTSRSQVPEQGSAQADLKNPTHLLEHQDTARDDRPDQESETPTPLVAPQGAAQDDPLTADHQAHSRDKAAGHATPVSPQESGAEAEAAQAPAGIVSWPVDPASPHPEALPGPERTGGDAWIDLAREGPAFGTEHLPSPEEDMAAYRRSRRLRRLLLLLFFTMVLAAASWAAKQPTGQALLDYARYRLQTVAADAGSDRDSESTGMPEDLPGLEPFPVASIQPRTDGEDNSKENAGQTILPGLESQGQQAETAQAQAGEDGNPEKPRHLVNKAVGYLYLKTVPPADVYIDGVKLPVRTPLKGYPVARGRRKLVVKTDDGETRGPFTIIVKAGKRKYIKTIVIRKKRRKH